MTPPRPDVVWLDRDGTLLVDPGYLSDPTGVVLWEGAAPAVARLNRAGVAVVLITNQSGIARGVIQADQLKAIHEAVTEELSASGAHLDGIYFCPHLPAELVPAGQTACDCRKPKPGLIARARENGGPYAEEFVVGDKMADVELARAIGATAVLVRTGEGEKTLADHPDADYVAQDLAAAVDWILEGRHAARTLE